jgi:sterol desaturase/sphingolipid hydroxylase (fatty acid hydroxylase superfamily)
MFDRILTDFIAPVFYPLLPQHRFFWLYLLSALIIALIACYVRQPSDGKRSFRRAILDVFPRRVFMHPSALLDYRFVFINHAVNVVLFGVLVISTVTSTEICLALLQFSLSEDPVRVAPGALASLGFTICLLLAVDGGLFLAHWLQHKVPLLWEFHKVHHAAEVLTPITDMRMHPVDTLVSTFVQTSLIGTVNAVFLYLYSDPVTEVTVIGANAIAFTLYLAGYHLKHSHVWILYPRGIREHISSPALHLIHHSTNPKHFDKNFARFFTFWDRLAGTLYIPDCREELEFGLGEKDQRELSTVWQLYVTPFRNVLTRLRRRVTRSRRAYRGAESAP